MKGAGLTLAEVMDRLDLTRSQIFDALAAGEIEALAPTERLGRKGVRIEAESLERYLAGRGAKK